MIEAATGKVVATIPLRQASKQASMTSRLTRPCQRRGQEQFGGDDSKYEVAGPADAPGEKRRGWRRLKNHRHRRQQQADADDGFANGRVLAQVPIGAGADATWFDPDTMYAFTSSGDGTTTIAKEESGNKLTVVQTLKTAQGARTMTGDPATHRIYLATAEFQPPPAGAAPGRGRATMVPNSMKILVFGLNGK